MCDLLHELAWVTRAMSPTPDFFFGHFFSAVFDNREGRGLSGALRKLRPRMTTNADVRNERDGPRHR